MNRGARPRPASIPPAVPLPPMATQSPTTAVRFASLPEAYAWLEGRVNNERRLAEARYVPEEFNLDCFRDLLRALGDPQRGRESVHVAGSVGKGSSTLFLETLLRSQGERVATYLSPHPREFRERIRLNGEPLSGEDFARLLGVAASVPRSAGSGGHPLRTVFEYLTAVFFLAAREWNASRMAVETGLGGRLDATNALDPGPVLWTRIGIEHAPLLGTSIPEIAGEKAAILKPGGWAVAAEQEPGGGALEVFRARGAATGAAVERDEDICALEEAEAGPEGLRLVYRWMGAPFALKLPLYGPFLARNLRGALAVVDRLARRGRIGPIDREAARRALESMRMEGRMEPVSDRPRLLTDGGHCPAAGRAAAEAMAAHFGNGPGWLAAGMASDKDHREYFREIAAWPGWRGAVVYTLPGPRGTPAALLAEAARPWFPRVEMVENLESALQYSAAATDESYTILAAGSTYSTSPAAEWGKRNGCRHDSTQGQEKALPRAGSGDS